MNKLSLRDKIGYSLASIGDSVSYMFVATFILFFLTTVAGIQPAIAGAITAFGSVWDAVVNPIMGYITDHVNSRWGRRRPFMFGFCVPLFIVIIMTFTAVDFNSTFKIIYYTFMIMAFWTSFTGFFIPYYALGAEYTKDYDERTSLRTYASFFNMIGTVFSMVMPTMMVDIFSKYGMSVRHAWQLTAVFLAALTVSSILITAVLSKDKDTAGSETNEEDAAETVKAKAGMADMFREYLQLLKLKPLKWLLMASLFYLIVYELILSDFVYLLTYNLGFTGSSVSAAMFARCAICMVLIPLVAKICSRTDKRIGQMLITAFGIAGLLTVRFLPLENIACLLIFIMIAAVTTQTYWQIIPAMFYDVCEYDEYETGNRREGAILSVQGLVEAVASGIGAQILGLILQFAGFDGNAAVQSETAMTWILNCTTWVPVIFLIFAGFALYKFPITKAKYNEIVRKLEERKHGS